MKIRAVALAGLTFFIAGIILRGSAHDLAWPDQWSYSGDRESTNWAVDESMYQDVSYFLVALGVALIAVAGNRWLGVEKSNSCG